MTTEQQSSHIQYSETRPSVQYIAGETLVKLGVGGAAISVGVGLIEAIGPKPVEIKYVVADVAFLSIAGLGAIIKRRESGQQR